MKYLFISIGIIFVGLLLVLPLPTYEIPLLHFSNEKEPEAHIIFGGDMMFDRYIGQIAESVGGDYLFSCIDQALLSADAVVANLEGPITRNPSKSIGTAPSDDGHYTFTFPPETARLLERHHISIVNIGNNHIANFGQEGILETKEYLTKNDVAYFGAPDDEEPSLDVTLKGVPFTFINYNQFGPTIPINRYSLLIQKARNAGRVPVVYAHWGEEYVGVTEKQRVLAHGFVDSGAALVMGSHPHIVQEVERYKNTYIYYSLGNFIFDQYFTEEVMNGLLLSVTFTKEGVVSIQEIPIKLHTDGRTCIDDPVER